MAVLIRRLREDVDGHLLEQRIEAGVGALGGEARELRQPVRAADSLQVLVEDLVGGQRRDRP